MGKAQEFRYDLFANPVFSVNPAKDCLGAAVWGSSNGNPELFDFAQITDLRKKLAILTDRILSLVQNSTAERLAQATRSTMIGIARNVLKFSVSDELALAPLHPPFDFRVTVPQERLADYYDWRSDLRDA
jgi:hypothetical protein